MNTSYAHERENLISAFKSVYENKMTDEEMLMEYAQNFASSSTTVVPTTAIAKTISTFSILDQNVLITTSSSTSLGS